MKFIAMLLLVLAVAGNIRSVFSRPMYGKSQRHQFGGEYFSLVSPTRFDTLTGTTRAPSKNALESA